VLQPGRDMVAQARQPAQLVGILVGVDGIAVGQIDGGHTHAAGGALHIAGLLIFRLANRLGRYATRTRFVELVVNNDYQGVYVLMERIKRDKNRVDISTLNPDEREGDDLTGGYIVRIDGGGAGWVSPHPPRPGLDKQVYYTYHYPRAADITPEQADELERRVNLIAENPSQVVAALKFAGARSFAEINQAGYEKLDGFLRKKENQGGR